MDESEMRNREETRLREPLNERHKLCCYVSDTKRETRTGANGQGKNTRTMRYKHTDVKDRKRLPAIRKNH